MSVLVDTSVWIGHFRQRDEVLVDLLLRDDALSHPMVLGGLACGTPPSPRERTLSDSERLRSATTATWSEIRTLIEGERLYGLGCGVVDIALLASTLLTPAALLWTNDRRLDELAARFEVAFRS